MISLLRVILQLFSQFERNCPITLSYSMLCLNTRIQVSCFGINWPILCLCGVVRGPVCVYVRQPRYLVCRFPLNTCVTFIASVLSETPTKQKSCVIDPASGLPGSIPYLSNLTHACESLCAKRKNPNGQQSMNNSLERLPSSPFCWRV